MPLVRINKNPSHRQLAVFAIAWFGFLGLWGAASWLRGRHLSAEIIWALGAAVPAAGFVAPRFIRLVYLAMSYLTYPIGFAASHVFLALTYYLALTPIGVTMRLFRYDPLSRRFDPAADTYRRPRGGTKSAEDYFRQS